MNYKVKLTTRYIKLTNVINLAEEFYGRANHKKSLNKPGSIIIYFNNQSYAEEFIRIITELEINFAIKSKDK